MTDCHAASTQKHILHQKLSRNRYEEDIIVEQKRKCAEQDVCETQVYSNSYLVCI